MNLKERGITVGDLIIILILIFTSTILVKSFNKDKKTTLNKSYQKTILISFEKISLSKINKEKLF